MTEIRTLGRRSFLALGGAALAQGAGLIRPAQAVQAGRSSAAGQSFYLTTVNLNDPNTFLHIGLANNAPQANSAQRSFGAEPFPSMVSRLRAAVVANGTFFAQNAQLTVMGNMVSGGRFLKYSQWENFGTTLGLRVGNRPEMVTARAERVPQWDRHWFSITCGPRLLRGGSPWINPALEGFRDPRVISGAAARTAIGFSQDGQRLMLVNFNSNVTLQQEAQVMQAIGCHEAMNLDGGGSSALASRGQILVPAGRPLTNVIAVYTAQAPAPTWLQQSWARFQLNGRVES